VVGVGPRLVLAAAGIIGAAGFALLAAEHTRSWQVITAAVIVNSAVGIAYAAMPALIVMHVEPAVTGIANSVNSIARSVGSSVGSAIVVTVLASRTGLLGLPSESGYTLVFVLGAVGFAVVALSVLLGLTPARRALSAEQAREEQALAVAGEFASASL
jgi:MFS family permease